MAKVPSFFMDGKCIIDFFNRQSFVKSPPLARFMSSVPSQQISEDEEEFRILDLKLTKSTETVRRKVFTRKPTLPPRTKQMALDQDWTSVWPGPRTFHPASVPLPLRQGINKLGASPGKFANTELMKIPNFLHLTPPAIKKHCEALKKFCTPWPEGLKTDEDCKKHFPLEVISSDYCHSAPTIRNPLSRIVSIKFPLSRLTLDKHARDKFLRLVGERYDEETDTVTIVADKCPLKQQNYDYALYLLTAVYHESWTFEPWEEEKTEADYEYYDWDNSASRKNVEYVCKTQNTDSDLENPMIKNYKEAVIGLFDEGENDYTLEKYKSAAVNLLFKS